MKKLIVSSLVALAAVCGQASDWLYDASANTITEQVAAGDPWVFNVTVVDATANALRIGNGGTEAANGLVASGSSTHIDLSGAIKDADGDVYALVELGRCSLQSVGGFTGFTMPDTVTLIGVCAFDGCPDLESVRLSEGLETIDSYAFRAANKLKHVTPLFPSSLKVLENDAFRLETRSIEDEVITISSPEFTAFPGWVMGTESPFLGFNPKVVDISESGAIGLRECLFQGMTNLTTVKLPKSLNMIYGTGYSYCFQNCSALKDIVFQSLPSDLQRACDANLLMFDGTTPFGVRILYCPTLGEWDDFIEQHSGWQGIVTLWNNIPDDDSPARLSKARYWENFGDDAPVPTGTIRFWGTEIWLVKYAVEVKTKNLKVTGNVLATADEGFDPVYGDYLDVQGGKTCVAPDYAYLGGVAYSRMGWTLEKATDDGWVQVSSGLTGACEFDQDDAGSYRLTWQWSPYAFAITVGDFPASLGRCMVQTPPNFGDRYYLEGSSVTVSAIPAEGITFERWIGDVAEEDRKKSTAVMTIDGPKTVLPYFRGKWIRCTYGPWPAVSNGYWTMTVDEVEAGKVQVGGPAVIGPIGIVDFSTGIEGGGEFVAIEPTVFQGQDALEECIMADTMTEVGDAAFRDAANLRRVVLSKNLVRIGSYAFYSCTALSELTPFFPEGLKEIGSCAFSYTSSLRQDVVLPAGVNADLDVDRAPGSGQFYDSGITSIDLSKSLITRVGANAFRESAVTHFDFPSTLTEIASYAVAWSNLGGVRTFLFRGGPVTIADYNLTDPLSARLVITGEAEAWQRYFAETEGCETVKLTTEEKASYMAAFPGERCAKFKVKDPNIAYQYVVYPEKGLMILIK